MRINKFFPQYLFNANEITGDKLRRLLKVAPKAEASLAVRALRKFNIPGQLFLEMYPLEDNAVGERLIEEKIVDEKGLADLRSEPGDAGLNFIQSLLDTEMYTPAKVLELLKNFDDGPCPICVVMENEFNGNFDQERDPFCEYVKSFVDSLNRFTGEIAIVSDARGVDPVHAMGVMPQEFNGVSQRIGGDQSLVAGIAAVDEDWCGLASCYSGETIPLLNDMAVDSVSELLNVINGIYAVEMARKHLEMDLDTPRSAQMPAFPQPEKLIVKVSAACGEFYLILAKEEFLPPTTIF